MASIQCQQFCLPSSIIYYIIKNPCSYIASLKLYKTCKYFYAQKKIFFIQNFYHKIDILNYFECYNYPTKNVNFWFGERLTVEDCYKNFPSHKIYCCTVKTFSLINSKIALSDFEIITKENTIKDFYLSNGFIMNTDGSNASMDFVLLKLPNVEIFCFSNKSVTVTHEQFQNMEATTLWNKFKNFSADIFYASEFFDSGLILNFIKKSAAPFFKFKLIFDGLNSEKNCINFKNSFAKEFRNWNGKFEMEIYHKFVPFEVLREKLRKRCAQREASKNAQKE